ncbi:beta-ketoacyl-[acyl-carrier-protein] synthase family protein [Achromobacter sp. NFACC18-2]|uniref:beta-ketoacyl-[acyl-carrier-protein] synthase family protein n=1 Tax=Achromobacter sp. NFACC18-2 TaxID=1564112 RepID=UPI0008CED2B8|nr:beta-ketoacyl-[acyl-carrier-protein] synthase family protein [Achromobacter sp. NFACC18-2]SEK06575.1 3-oxoacyl-[acyl-carrier-protein] synthase-1 [Achromobacter sp. NFACC18-2]
MMTWLGTPGVVCALGAGVEAVGRAAFAGDTTGMRAQAGWVNGRVLTLGACTGALPALPRELPAHHHSRNNQLLLAAATQIEAPLRAAIARYGADRVAVVLGTSTSGVNDNAPAFRDLRQHGAWPATYDYRRQALSSPGSFLADWLGTTGPAYTLSTACTSSARALLSAQRLLRLGLCDAVVCGGADTLCRLTINGFATLEAVDDALCTPFSVHRRGINIGEAGVLFLMERDPADANAVALLGGGASSDAWHMSAPDPTGEGARRAMLAALRSADVEAASIGWLNLHGTGTPHNDAMESHATNAVFPNGVPCASTKALTGHTLGAAGALEAALAWITLSASNAEGRLMPHVWDGHPDPALPALEFSTPAHRYAAGRRRVAMSNSFAFGGNNASLVFGGHP